MPKGLPEQCSIVFQARGHAQETARTGFLEDHQGALVERLGLSRSLTIEDNCVRGHGTQRFTTRQSCPRALSAVQSSSALARSGKYPAWTR